MSAIDTISTIIRATTAPLRKGQVVTHSNIYSMDVVHVYDMPSVDEIELNTDIVTVDVHFILVAVNVPTAQTFYADLVEALDTLEAPLDKGLSYIALGAEIGSQQAALCLMALGEVLNLWKVIIPATLGFTGIEAELMAGQGLVLTNGYTPLRPVQ